MLVVAVLMALVPAGCSAAGGNAARGIVTDVSSTEVAASPAKLAPGRSFESTIAGVGDAASMFDAQASLGSELTSGLAGHWASQEGDPVGNHLVLVFDVFGGRATSTGAELYVDVFEQWWSRSGASVTPGTASHGPIRVRLAGPAGALRLAGYDTPQDGDAFAPGVDRLFPQPYSTRALEAQGGVSAGLEALSRRLATAWAAGQ